MREGRDRFPPPDQWWIEPVYRDTSRVPLTLQEKIDRRIYAKMRRWVYEQHRARVERNAARERAARERAAAETLPPSLPEPTFSLEEIEDDARSPAQAFNEEEVAEMMVEMNEEELDNLMAGMTQEEYADFIAKMKEGQD